MTFTNFLKLANALNVGTLVEGRASTPYTFNYCNSDGWAIEVNTYRVFVQSPDKQESTSINLDSRTLLYNTLSTDNPCERHFWFWNKMSEEEYFQNSLINPAFSLSYEENQMVNDLLLLVMNHVGGGVDGIEK